MEHLNKMEVTSLNKMVESWETRGEVWLEIFKLADAANPNVSKTYVRMMTLP